VDASERIYVPNSGGTSGNTYAANNYYNSISVYGAGANGNAKPTGIIKGVKTKLDSPKGIAIR
jgi:hypothetical protein